MLSKNFYIIASCGLLLLTANYLMANWIIFNLGSTDYQAYFRKYAYVEISIICFNFITICWYCYQKMFWVALFSFILIDLYNLINAIDAYFYFWNNEPFLVTDNLVFKYMVLILPTIHFILIGLSKSRKSKWLMFYAVFGILCHFLVSVAGSMGFFRVFEWLSYTSCLAGLLIILNYRDEIKLLKKSESDQVLDMD